MAIIDASVPRSFTEILGGILGAVIDAQAQSSRATIEFIENVGTLEGSIDTNTVHELRNMSFNFTKKDEHDKLVKFTLELPLLSMVEIPAINIKTAKFSFYYDVTSTDDTSTTESLNVISDNSANDTKWKGVKKPIKLFGRVKKETDTKSQAQTNAGIKVDVEFEKSASSIGMEKILDILELSVKETKA